MATVISMTINERIKYLRRSRHMSQQELADAVGFRTASAVNKIEAGLRNVNNEKLISFAKALGVSASYLLDGSEDDSDGAYYYNNTRSAGGTVPLIGSIACGLPILADENTECSLALPPDVNADFALRCRGDSMINARIFDGDIVYIRSQPDVDNGDIAAVLIGDEATLKRVHKYKNKLVLSPENPMYSDLVYRDSELEQVRILGRAVAFLGFIKLN